MSGSWRKRLKGMLSGILIAALLMTLWGGWQPDIAHASDEFDALRIKWATLLTGGPALDPADSDIAARTDKLAQDANDYWEDMDLSSSRTYIWYALRGNGTSDNVNAVYERLRTMALAATTVGSSLYGNADLKEDILDALDWLYVNSYNSTRSRSAYNWWHWQLGIPMSLNDIAVLLYDDISAARMATYMDTIDYFTPSIGLTGANRAWQAIVVGVRAVIVKDAVKLAAARNGLSGTGIFPYATGGDGFYADGSFVQHTTFAYTGGYGSSVLETTANLMYLLSGSTWSVSDPNQSNVWQWIYEAYRPLLYKGAMMDMVRGREISRSYAQDHAVGHGIVASIVRLAQFAPAPHAAAFKQIAKRVIQEDTFSSFYGDVSTDTIRLAKAIVDDPSIAPAAAPNLYKQYAAMDRAVLQRPGFALGLALYSTRISSYESINSENGRGWYTGAGATYLYNQDLAQYSEDYWPTVDAYRIPGTTVASGTPIASGTGTSSWTGGVSLAGQYGASGMDLSYGAYNLTARKSWFMFDDEIVALGSGISSTAGIPIETVVDNRKLNGAGDNAWTANGAALSTGLGVAQTLTGVNWVHLAGNTADGSDIGYYFPGGATLQTKREARTGTWKQINNRPATPSTAVTRNYETMWIDHGTNPSGASYGYVLLPNKTSAQVGAYAADPAIEIVANTSGVQSVKEKTLGLVGANFWTDTTQTADLITSNKKASVMTREIADERLEASVSDPTQANNGTIAIELARSAEGYSADPGITVTQLAPTIKFTVNVNGAKGKSFHASFQLGEDTSGPVDPGEPELPSVIVDNADSAGVTRTGTWKTASTQTDRYGANYLHDDNAGKGTKSVTFTPNLPIAGSYEVYLMWPAHFNREDAV
ncbi:polysaccharide lyase beta-sandwich domain-containing protein [Cohnella rhizosphaerae]|uniref:Polysaccharide lyase beta-sandwich domain-containing protein n=1 Tax=Cohnella rhizosphaerae TaxID=1457232 RepID=A0A9X4QS97_9BACL|nr:polysaccharide lyase family 8 super-sandwich domain-containing protein [Cohnella rhizosphaerae]MDG0808302.1 polysaccharide lyase beta-sandwich domain-containing protein [Cohnella rhizosphaerae]